jgi:hypothetical protein
MSGAGRRDLLPGVSEVPGQRAEIAVGRCGAGAPMISGMPPLVGLILLAGMHMSRVQDPLQKGESSLLPRAPDDVVWGAFLNDDATIHEDHAVSHLPGERHLMGDHDHGHPFGGKLSHHREHVADKFGIQCRRRLVEEHQARVH